MFPLHEYEIVRSRDPDYTQDMIGKIFVPHRLALVGSRPTLRARAHVRRLTDTAVNVVTYGGEVQIEPEPLETFFTLHITLSGTSLFRVGNTEITATQPIACVVSPTDHLVMRWNHDCIQLICRIERPALEAHLSRMLGNTFPHPLQFEPRMPVAGRQGGTVAPLIRAVVDDIDRGTSAVDQPATEGLFERHLMTNLLLAQRHNYSDALATEVPAAGARQVRLAIAIMDSHPELPQTLPDVAAAAQVSSRSLQRALQRDYGTSFTDILRTVRLRHAHNDLVHSSSSHQTVNAILERWLLPVQGHTFAAYHRIFGESPGETLRLRP